MFNLVIVLSHDNLLNNQNINLTNINEVKIIKKQCNKQKLETRRR